jgi:predicted dehydrogenase
MTKIAILDFAHGHVMSYCNEWQENDMGIDVVCGWDHDAERLNEKTDALGIPAINSLQDAIDMADAVVITSETNRHADLVIAAAEAGKGIVLQKPMATTLADADRIIDVLNRTEVPFTMAWQMRVDPQNLKMKELVTSSALGKVLMVRRRHGLSTHKWDWFPGSWHVDPEANRDIWADDVAHAVDFLYWLLGKPLTVTAEIDTLVNPDIPNDNGIAIFRYPSGTIAEVNSSFTCVAGENTCEIVCENGVIIQNYGDAPSAGAPRPEGAIGLKWYTHGDSEWTVSDIPSPDSHSKRLAGLDQPLADYLNGKGDPVCTAEEGRDTLRIVDTTYISSQEGQRISLNL